eukprot:610380_1
MEVKEQKKPQPSFGALYFSSSEDEEEANEIQPGQVPEDQTVANTHVVDITRINADGTNEKKSYEVTDDNSHIIDTKGKYDHKSPSPQNSAQTIPPFPPHMTVKEASSLQVHDQIDHRDPVGRFVFATVEEKQGTKLKIHYDGWSKKWDVWSDFEKEIHRFAAAGSISRRAPHRLNHLKKGDHVDINPTQRHCGWKIGEIQRVTEDIARQVQVVYEHLDQNYLYWTHVDNEDEIAEFLIKSNAEQKQNMNDIDEMMEGHANVMDTKGFKGEDEGTSSKANDETEKVKMNESSCVVSPKEQRARQFEMFLKRNNLETYADTFVEQCCNDLEFVDMFTDELLQNDIKMQNKFLRKRFLSKCVEMKDDMDRLKDECGISSVLYNRLAKYGLVTMNILCEEIKKQSDLKDKYQIDNDNQCNFVWQLIQKCENQNHDQVQAEGTPYI